MNLPCGHPETQNRHLQGKPWVTDNGRHLACRVCWLHWNGPPFQATNNAPAAPLPVTAWPRWAKALARRKRDGEAGVGDTLERLLRHLGGNAFKAAYRRLTGGDCGCTDRQARLNVAYPY